MLAALVAVCAVLLATCIPLAEPSAAAPSSVAMCASCHGGNGMGNADAGYPALAGLPAPYIERQLAAFKHGGRKNATMQSMADPLNAKQRAAIATYYGDLTVPSTPQATTKLNAPGEKLAMDGAWDGKLTGVPACDSCHGPYGVGVGTAFPRFAGQPQSYISAQLAAWKNGSRTDDPLHLMRTIAEKLSPEQIAAVSAYFAALPPNPTRLPGITPGGQK